MTVELLYAANPMCSWCWGFAPVVRELARAYGDRVRITPVLGALRLGEGPLTPSAMADLRHHWERVQGLTGQPFDFAFLEREGFVYDTEPACRAAAVVRALHEELALTYIETVQEAFYAKGEDVTQGAVLQRLAEAVGADGAAFARAFGSPEAQAAVAREFADVARLGVTGYPTLLGLTDGRARVLSLGCRPLAAVEADLAGLLASA